MSNSQKQANEMYQAFLDRNNASKAFDDWCNQNEATFKHFSAGEMIDFARFFAARVKGTEISISPGTVEFMREGGAI